MGEKKHKSMESHWDKINDIEKFISIQYFYSSIVLKNKCEALVLYSSCQFIFLVC